MLSLSSSLLACLFISVEEVLAQSKLGQLKEGTAAIYGMTSALPAGPVKELLKVYNDVILKC